MHIRAATMDDMPALIELWTVAGLTFRPGDVPAELRAVLARDPELVLLADDGQVLAAAVLGTFDGRRGWVNRLATRPGQRGQGYATALLTELERRLAAKGCRKVNLLIEADNRPVTGFYGQNGYSADQLIFMEKRLPAICASVGRREHHWTMDLGHLKAELDRLAGAIEHMGGRVTERDLNYIEDSAELFYERDGERYEIHLKRLPDRLAGSRRGPAPSQG
jgi:ribosomal protein S18 acetylase RimI-like enzyme